VSDNWIVRRRPWKALTTAVLTTTSVVWVPQAPSTAASSGAFVSSWDGPIVSRQFQFQSVAKPAGEPVADPVVATPFGWPGQYATPERKLSRAHLAEGVSRPLGALETVQVAWQAPLAVPTVRVSRTALAEGVAWTPQIITAPAGATTPSDWWGDKYSPPYFPPTRVALLNGYVKPWHQPANPTASSGAFTSSWDGPIVSRQFQYQSKVAPISVPLAFLAAQSAWDGPYFYRAFLYEEMASFVKAPDAVAGATTPSELGWARAYAEPVRRKRLEAGSTATVFAPPTVSIGWWRPFDTPVRRELTEFNLGTLSFTPGQLPTLAVTPTQLAFWSLFGTKPAAKLAKPWFYPANFYTPGQTAGGTAPAVDERNTGAWLSKKQVEALKRKQQREREAEERRLQDKLTAERALQQTIREAYARATGGPVAEPAEAAPLAAVVKPFVKPTAAKSAALPPAPAIDWRGLAADLGAAKRLLAAVEQLEIARLKRIEDEDDEEAIMFLLMSE
jgi:hypothetical protein